MKLNEGAIILNAELNALAVTVVDILRTHLIKPYDPRTPDKDVGFGDESHFTVKKLDEIFSATIIRILTETIQSEGENLDGKTYFLNDVSEKRSIHDVMIDDELYMIHYPSIIAGKINDKKRSYEQEVSIVDGDYIILCYDGEEFYLYVDYKKFMENEKLQNHLFKDDTNKLISRGLIQLAIFDKKNIETTIENKMIRAFSKYDMRIQFKIEFGNKYATDFKPDEFLNSGGVQFSLKGDYGILYIKTRSVETLYKTLVNSIKTDLLIEILRHEFVHIIDVSKRRKTALASNKPISLTVEKISKDEDKFKDSDDWFYKRDAIYISSDIEIQGYGKSIAELVVNYIIDTTLQSDVVKKLNECIRHIDTTIVETKDYYRDVLTESNDYVVIQRYLNIRFDDEIKVPTEEGKLRIINGKKVWKRLTFYVVDHIQDVINNIESYKMLKGITTKKFKLKFNNLKLHNQIKETVAQFIFDNVKLEYNNISDLTNIINDKYKNDTTFGFIFGDIPSLQNVKLKLKRLDHNEIFTFIPSNDKYFEVSYTDNIINIKNYDTVIDFMNKSYYKERLNDLAFDIEKYLI